MTAPQTKLGRFITILYAFVRANPPPPPRSRGISLFLSCSVSFDVCCYIIYFIDLSAVGYGHIASMTKLGWLITILYTPGWHSPVFDIIYNFSVAGYGHVAPLTKLGRFVTILYALVGTPVLGESLFLPCSVNLDLSCDIIFSVCFCCRLWSHSSTN